MDVEGLGVNFLIAAGYEFCGPRTGALPVPGLGLPLPQEGSPQAPWYFEVSRE